MERIAARIAVAMALIASVGSAHATDRAAARTLAAGCASCHQPGQQLPPPLSGQPRDALIAKLRGYRDGTRSGTVMPQIVRGYTDAELDAAASRLAGEPSRR